LLTSFTQYVKSPISTLKFTFVLFHQFSPLIILNL